MTNCECGAILTAYSSRCLRCGRPANVRQAPLSRAVRFQNGGANAARKGAGATAGLLGVDALADPSDEEIRHWFDAVRLSAPVVCNAVYAEIAANAEVEFDRANEVLNAYAVHDHDLAHRIVICGGIVRAYALTAVAAALAQQDADDDPSRFADSFRPYFHGVARCINSKDRHLRPGTAHPSTVFSGEDFAAHEILQRARSHLTGMMLALIAHEMGHVVLLHNLSELPPNGSPAQLAMEHQADAFARAVCESVPFQSHVTFAGFLDGLLWSWIDEAEGPRTTHPGSRSRLLRFVDENIELARFGITPKSLPHFLPGPPV